MFESEIEIGFAFSVDNKCKKNVRQKVNKCAKQSVCIKTETEKSLVNRRSDSRHSLTIQNF